ncbi:MAG: ANTAR domain-containing response regulator [Lachnospirales bacterium]
MEKNILIAEDEPIIRMDLCEILVKNGFNVVAEAKDGFDAIEMCMKHNPDIALLDVKMPLLDGLKAAEIIKKENLAKEIVMLSAYCDTAMIEKAKKAEVLSYITKPISESALIASLNISFNKQKIISKKANELKKLKQTLEERKIIEKSKGILMVKKNMTEEEAYSYIRKVAMDKQCKMVRISEIIIISNQ